MPTTAMLICHVCSTQTDVTPRVTVSFKGGAIPTFDPPTCSGCHRLLRPTPDEWAVLLRCLAAEAEPVPPNWWDDYAVGDAPPPLPTTTA